MINLTVRRANVPFQPGHIALCEKAHPKRVVNGLFCTLLSLTGYPSLQQGTGGLRPQDKLFSSDTKRFQPERVAKRLAA